MMTYRAKTFSATLVLALIAVVLLTLVYVILLKGVREGERAIREVEGKIAASKEREEAARAASALLQQRRGDIARITAFLVDKEKPVVFIETIENLAKNTGNRLELTLAGDERKDSELAFIALVQGTEEGVMRYLKLLELLPYAITFDTVRFERTPSDTGTASHRLTLGLRVRTQ